MNHPFNYLKNWILCRLLGCVLSEKWDTSSDGFIIWYCGRCGFPQHHYKVRKGVFNR